ncbi:hypothetical protein SARC_00038 [Sphaeroforma arctica JP610]|uniref:UPF3 domain-containing protein n=1 Tax=Sphaeroforma arctica JP610 TaxID=667725 RepID=A0A0L0GFD7_9EUKA|nr:hypothetical protein SARC_00038 [Sphaeroforma arctica JP610]KNC87780.1 hypothetical protein SARC_00038 [Sphaeroforma arctica JP610]|eukprot:XP_014161682.1 hypothetical protein SARC_00038 [Sphaeroforma arctica JP610]
MSTAHLADGDGNPIMPVVEFAPNQSNGLLQSKTKRSAGNPNASKGKSRKADYRANTLETDKDYLAFLEVLSAEREEIYNANLHTESDKPKVDSKEVVATPLLDFIKTIKSSRKGGSGTGSSDKRSNRRSEKTGTSSTSQSSSSTTKKRRERDPEKREDQKVYKVKRSTRPSGDGEKRASNKKSAFGGDLTAETSKGDTAVRGSTSSPVKKKERKRRSDRATGETEASAGDGPGNGKERHTSSSTSSSSKRRSNRDPASTGGSSRGAATSATAPGGATDSTTKKTSKPPSAASAESRAKSSKSGSGSGSRSRRGGGGSANKTSSNPPA